MIQPLSPRAHASPDRRKALVLVLLYAIVLLLPGAHVFCHEHGGLPPAPGEGPGYLVAACGCGGHCDNPDHHHHDHVAAHDCALCQALASWKAAPDIELRSDCALSATGHLVDRPPVLWASAVRTPHSARDPPDSFAS